MAQRVKELSLYHSHCYEVNVVSLIPGLRTSTYCGCSQKKKKKAQPLPISHTTALLYLGWSANSKCFYTLGSPVELLPWMPVSCLLRAGRAGCVETMGYWKSSRPRAWNMQKMWRPVG